MGVAVARALNRTLLFPRAACYCERSWAPLLRCRLLAVAAMRLPFECPFDHMANPTLWEKSGVSFRPPNFQPAPGASSATVRIGDASQAAAGGAVDLLLKSSLTDAQLNASLLAFRDVDVLRITGEAPALCGLFEGLQTPWHVAHSGKQANDLTAYLLDQRIFFCAQPAGVAELPDEGGMVAKLCGRAEELAAATGPRAAFFGVVRALPDCPCDWGYALPAPLPLLAEDRC
jgi:hypothetical protein